MSKFNIGDKVRVIDNGELEGPQKAYLGHVGTVIDESTIPYVKFDDGITVSFFETKLEFAIEIPASPFYIRNGRNRFKIEVSGLSYLATNTETGESYGDPTTHQTRHIPGMFSSGNWTLIDPPAPAVDPVVAAAAEVQRLLREQEEAKAECDAASAVAEAAEIKRRNIGKALADAHRALSKANHEAAGVEYVDNSPEAFLGRTMTGSIHIGERR